MEIETAEHFAKCKELIHRMDDFRDFMATFTDADMAYLHGFIDYYSNFEAGRVKEPRIKPFCCTGEVNDHGRENDQQL